MASSSDLNASATGRPNPITTAPRPIPPMTRHTPTNSAANYSPTKERGSFSVSTKAESSSFGSQLRTCFRGMFLCCTGCDGDEGGSDRGSGSATRTGSVKGMVISGPTNFRREELHIPGLTPDQERLFRNKQSSDAKRMWTSLQPLRSSPSGTFIERPTAASTSPTGPLSATLPPTYEEFTQPRSAPATPSTTAGGGGDRTPRESAARLKERVKNQGRRMSGNFSGARIFSGGSGGSSAPRESGRSISGGSGARGGSTEGMGVGLGVIAGGHGVGGGGGGHPTFAASAAPPRPLRSTPPASGNVNVLDVLAYYNRDGTR